MLKVLLHVLWTTLILEDGRKALYFTIVLASMAVVFLNLFPSSLKLSSIQRQVGDELVNKAVDKFPWDTEVGTVEMITSCGLWANYFSKAVRERVTNYKSDGSRKFDILQEGFIDRVCRMVGMNVGRKTLSEKEILRRLKNTPADTLLILNFSESEYLEDEKKATAAFSCSFYKKSGGEPLVIPVNATYVKNEEAGVCTRIARGFKGMSSPTRIVCGLLAILFFPFFAAPITWMIVRRQKVRANAWMVASYSIILMIAIGLLFPFPTTFVGALLYCAVAVSVLYWILFTSELIASPGFKKRMQRVS